MLNKVINFSLVTEQQVMMFRLGLCSATSLLNKAKVGIHWKCYGTTILQCNLNNKMNVIYNIKPQVSQKRHFHMSTWVRDKWATHLGTSWTRSEVGWWYVCIVPLLKQEVPVFLTWLLYKSLIQWWKLQK